MITLFTDYEDAVVAAVRSTPAFRPRGLGPASTRHSETVAKFDGKNDYAVQLQSVPGAEAPTAGVKPYGDRINARTLSGWAQVSSF